MLLHRYSLLCRLIKYYLEKACDKKSGVSDYANNNVITVIPNPASSKIKIFGTGDDVKAEFVSLAGSIVKVSDKSEISLEDVASGVYMLRITTPSETVVKKLVVKK